MPAPIARGLNPYAYPAGAAPRTDAASPNPFTLADLEAFFEEIPEDDVRSRVINQVLLAPNATQALQGMLTGIGGPWAGFDTTPTLPKPDLIVVPGTAGFSGGGGGRQGRVRTELV